MWYHAARRLYDKHNEHLVIAFWRRFGHGFCRTLAMRLIFHNFWYNRDSDSGKGVRLWATLFEL